MERQSANAALPLYEAEAAKRKAQAAGQPRGQKQKTQTSLEADLPQETDEPPEPEPKKRAPQARDRAAYGSGVSGGSDLRGEVGCLLGDPFGARHRSVGRMTDRHGVRPSAGRLTLVLS